MNRDDKQDADQENPLERALWQISILDLDAFSINDRLKAVAAIFLTALSDFTEDGGTALIAAEARNIYKSCLSEAPALAEDMRGLSRERIAQLVDDIFLPALDPHFALERAQTQKQVVKEVNGADIVLIAQALQSLLPPVIRDMLLKHGIIDETPGAEWAKNLIKTIATATAAELARKKIETAQNFPRDEVVDRLHDLTQNMTGEKLSTLFNHISSHYPAEDFVALAEGSVEVLRHVLEDVLRHGIPTKMPAAAVTDLTNWGEQARRFLSVLEDAARAAGVGDKAYALVEAALIGKTPAQQKPPPQVPPPPSPNP